MKPRIVLAESPLPGGGTLSLLEHDGRHYLQSEGIQVAGPGTRASERELARIACAPFRSARQPKIWISGLALGELLAGVVENLPQKRGIFIVAEAMEALAGWQREYFPQGPFAEDPRVQWVRDAGPKPLQEAAGSLHAVLFHADTTPVPAGGKPLYESERWLATVHAALQDGGLLGIASSRPLPGLERLLGRAGFEVARHEVDAAPNARRPRLHSVWLGRKGKSAE